MCACVLSTWPSLFLSVNQSLYDRVQKVMTLVISMNKLLSFKHLIILVFFKEKTNYSNEQKFHKIDSIVKNRMLICSVLCSSLANKWFIYIWIITMIIIIIINIGNVCAYITEKTVQVYQFLFFLFVIIVDIVFIQKPEQNLFIHWLQDG